MVPASDRKRSSLMELLIPAAASVFVALVTTYGVIAAGSSKLEQARQSATAATAEAKELTSRAEALGRALAASPVPVGSILSSSLSPDEFAQAAGDPSIFDPTKSKWALADGRRVVGSTYDELSKGKRLLDLRGLFLRGINSGRTDKWKDPDDDREPGRPQAWATGAPQQTPFAAAPAGEHAHNGPGGKPGFVGGGPGNHTGGPSEGPAYGAIAMTPAGNHTHTVSGGDTETRPNNAGVYFFVRINL